MFFSHGPEKDNVITMQLEFAGNGIQARFMRIVDAEKQKAVTKAVQDNFAGATVSFYADAITINIPNNMDPSVGGAIANSLQPIFKPSTFDVRSPTTSPRSSPRSGY